MSDTVELYFVQSSHDGNTWGTILEYPGGKVGICITRLAAEGLLNAWRDHYAFHNFLIPTKYRIVRCELPINWVEVKPA